MMLGPWAFDVWLVKHLASLLGRSPSFDEAVQEAMRNHLLGGVWFALAIFLLWARASKRDEEKLRDRLVCMMLGSGLAIAATMFVAGFVAWLPPNRNPELAALYPEYVEPNPNLNSFPSQSTAAHSVVATGVYGIHRRWGLVLWFAVLTVGALPRVYLGGHYPSDILGGLVCGAAGYAAGVAMLQPRLEAVLSRVLNSSARRKLILDLVIFLWILGLSTGFRHAVWAWNGLLGQGR